MKNTLLSLALAAVLTPALAQEPESEIDAMSMYSMNTCAETEYVENWLSVNSKEVPVVKGNGAIMSLNGEAFAGIWKVWANPETRSFTILIEFPEDGMTCVVGLGEQLEPDVSKNRIRFAQ